MTPCRSRNRAICRKLRSASSVYSYDERDDGEPLAAVPAVELLEDGRLVVAVRAPGAGDRDDDRLVLQLRVVEGDGLPGGRREREADPGLRVLRPDDRAAAREPGRRARRVERRAFQGVGTPLRERKVPESEPPAPRTPSRR